MIGVFFALLATFSFSMNAILVRRGVAQASAGAGAFVTVMMGVPLFLVAALATGQIVALADIPFSGYVFLSLAGVVHFVIGRYFNYRSVAAIGAARSGPIQTLTIPYSIFIAWAFLGEGVSIGMAIGIGLIIIGPAIMIERQSSQPKTNPTGSASDSGPQFQFKQVDGYISAFLASIFYGTSPILIRAALQDQSGFSVAGGLVSYTAAAALLVVSLSIPSRRGLIQAMHPKTARLFLGAGLFVFLAQMFRFIALSLAPVAVVTPLQRAGIIFTLILSWILNRRLEYINWKVVLGILISVSGSVTLIVSGTS